MSEGDNSSRLVDGRGVDARGIDGRGVDSSRVPEPVLVAVGVVIVGCSAASRPRLLLVAPRVHYPDTTMIAPLGCRHGVGEACLPLHAAGEIRTATRERTLRGMTGGAHA
ncbi:MAG: hypothetical protein ABL886_04720 [Rhodoglobus sp.]